MCAWGGLLVAAPLIERSKIIIGPPPWWPKFDRHRAEFGRIRLKFLAESKLHLVESGPNFAEFVPNSCRV